MKDICQEVTDWQIKKTLIWNFEIMLSDREYRDAKLMLLKKGFITLTNKGVQLTEKGLVYIQEKFGIELKDN